MKRKIPFKYVIFVFACFLMSFQIAQACICQYPPFNNGGGITSAFSSYNPVTQQLSNPHSITGNVHEGEVVYYQVTDECANNGVYWTVGNGTYTTVVANGGPTVKVTWGPAGTAQIGANRSCSSQAVQLTVVQCGNPFTITSNSTNACQVSPLVFTATASPGASTYQWFLNDQAISGASAQTYSVASLKNNDVIKCRLINGCRDASSNLISYFSNTITVTGADINAGADISICKGATGMNLAATGGVSYSWSPATGLSSTTIANPVANPTATTTYTATITDANGCIGTDKVVVTALNQPVAPTITVSPSAAVCAGQQITFTSSAAGTTGINVISRPAGSTILGGGSNGPGSIYETLVMGSAGGNYVVKSVSAQGCLSVATTKAVTVNANPTPGTITVSPSTTVCQGTTISVSVGYGTDYLSYSEPPLTHIGGGGGPGGWGFSATANGSGDFVLIKRNAAGCSTVTTVPFTVNPPPSSPATIEIQDQQGTPVTAVCANSFIYMILTSNDPNASPELISRPYMNVQSGTGFQGGYAEWGTLSTEGGNFVVDNVTAHGCRTQSIYGLTVNPNPGPTSITVSPSSTVCQGTTIGVSVSYGSDPQVYWSTPNLTHIGGGGGPGGFGFSAIANGSGNFVSIKRNAAGCSTTTTVPFTVTPGPLPPAPAVTASNTLICSGGGSAQLTTTVPGVTYQWRKNSVEIPGATANTYKATEVGTYTLKVTNSQDCFSFSSGINLTASAFQAPRVTVDPINASLCGAQTTPLNVGRALQFNGSGTANASAFNWPTGGPITIEFWTKVNTTDVGYTSAFGIGTDGNNRIQAHVPWIDNQVYWDYGNLNTGGRITAAFPSTYLNKWTHVALVSAGNGGNFKAIYLDGALAASAASSDGPDISQTGLLIGAYLSNFHRGTIDEFRIWNKVLNASEVMTAKNTQVPAGTAHLIGCWRMDEASGTVNDAVNGKNATLSGGVTRVYPTPLLTYSWTPTTGLSAATGTTVTASAPSGGSVIYTVRGTDANGCSNSAQVTITRLACREAFEEELEEAAEGWSVNMYPNPASTELNLQVFDAEAESVDLIVIDINGTTVYSDKVNTSDMHTFGVENLPSGVYIVQVSNKEEVKRLKLVITR